MKTSKLLTCDGRCGTDGDCTGVVRTVSVYSSDGRRCWGEYNYCDNAIAKDIKNGYLIKSDIPKPANSKHITNLDLQRLIGEIDGIKLESNGSRITVGIRISGKDVELITDYNTMPDHSITREGIRSVLRDSNIE